MVNRVECGIKDVIHKSDGWIVGGKAWNGRITSSRIYKNQCIHGGLV